MLTARWKHFCLFSRDISVFQVCKVAYSKFHINVYRKAVHCHCSELETVINEFDQRDAILGWPEVEHWRNVVYISVQLRSWRHINNCLLTYSTVFFFHTTICIQPLVSSVRMLQRTVNACRVSYERTTVRLTSTDCSFRLLTTWTCIL